MFVRLMNRASDNDSDYWYDGRSKSYSDSTGRTWKCWHFALVLVALFPYIAIPILFSMVSNNKSSSKTYNTADSTIYLTYAGSKAFSVGNSVSLSESGVPQLGAGSSLYKNIVDLQLNCPSYVDVDAVFSNSYLLSFSNKNQNSSTFKVIEVDSPNSGVIVSTTPSNYFAYETVTISQSSGIFVSICQDFSIDQDEAYVVAGKVGSNYKISFGQAVSYTSVYSVNPSIVRLDESTFAISYFTSTEPYILNTRYGYVDLTTLTVSLSVPATYADNNDIGMYTTMSAVSPLQYLLFFYDGYKDGTYVSAGPLSVVVANIPPEASLDTTIPAPSLSVVQVLDDIQVSVYMAATALNNETVVLAYCDASNSNGITFRAISVAGNSSVVLGSSLVATSGQSLIAVDNVTLSDFDVETLSTNGEFIVMFSDYSNDNAVTAITGALTATGDLLRTSPSYVVAPAHSSTYIWGALGAGATEPLATQLALVVVESNTVCAAVQDTSTMFAIMELLPSPLGIVSQVDETTDTSGDTTTMQQSRNHLRTFSEAASSGQEYTMIALSGVVDLGADVVLTVGLNYYTNTMGDLVAGNAFHGRTPSIGVAGSSDGSASQFYIFDESSDTILSLNSFVGVAVSSTEIFVNTK